MFNDVHLAKVSKINKTAEWSHGGGSQKHSLLNQHYPEGGCKTIEMQLNIKQYTKSAVDKTSDVEDAMLKLSEHGFVFGKTSPRCGPNEMETRLVRSTVPHSSQLEESADSTQKDNNESDNNISSCSTLDIVNKVENLSLLEFETQIKELSQRLRCIENERDELQHKLDECIEEKELYYRRLELISSAHESRITEMHCVIAELSKKLKTRQETTILEENEPDGSEISYQEESVCNSELNSTNPDAESRTEPFDRNNSICDSGKENYTCSEFGKNAQTYNDSVVKNRVEVLQEEVLHLKAQIALLQSEIAESSKYLVQEASTTFITEGNQNIQLLEGDVEANVSYSKMQNNTKLCNKISDNQVLPNNGSKENLRVTASCQTVSVSQSEALVPKMAEKIKLRHLKGTDNERTTYNWNSGLSSSGIVDSANSGSDFFLSSNLSERCLEASALENELQRLHRKLEQYKMRNVMLSLTLGECKEHCEELYLLCGKYESNAIALQSAVNCSDRAIEAYDVMLALLESKIALMKEKTLAAEESRKSVESVARNLLVRLDSEKNLNENSLGPWKNTFNFTDKSSTPWTAEDDNRLRYHVSKLKGRRSTVQNTIVNLESPFSACYEKTRLALEGCSEALFNLELPTQDCDSFTELSHAALTERNLVEAFTRESTHQNNADEKYQGLQKPNINIKTSNKKSKN